MLRQYFGFYDLYRKSDKLDWMSLPTKKNNWRVATDKTKVRPAIFVEFGQDKKDLVFPWYIALADI